MLNVTRVNMASAVAAPPTAVSTARGRRASRAWPDTLALLVRSHRGRLAAPDRSRPWLSAAEPAPEDTRA